MVSAMPALDLADVRAVLGDRTILDRVTLTLPAGGLIALVGPNGAGKSTLLAILAGLLAPATGEVRLDGEPLARLGDRARARVMGYLEQQPECHWPLSVAALARLGRLPHRGAFGSLDPRADEAAVEAALARTGMTGFRDRRIDHVLFFEVDDEEIATRLEKRRGIEGRADDDPSAVRRRLEAYRAQTAPVLDWYTEHGLVHRIMAVGSVEAVSARVREALDLS